MVVDEREHEGGLWQAPAQRNSGHRQAGPGSGHRQAGPGTGQDLGTQAGRTGHLGTQAGRTETRDTGRQDRAPGRTGPSDPLLVKEMTQSDRTGR